MENLSPNSLAILRAKYLGKNEKGEVVETPEDCFQRVAHAVAQAEEGVENRKFWEEKFQQIMANLEFLPGGRTLANAGTSFPQLANCFVLPMEDNIEEIFEVVKDSSILKKFGGGVGFSFSKIRPKGDAIAGTSGQACGPVALMKILDSASEIFMQDGKRRSGNMVVLSASHPDVLDFITAKKDQSSLPQVNYSLAVTNRFMEAVEKDEPWELVNPRTGRVTSTVNARSIFEVACAMSWENGDPGLIFLDRINRDNPTPNLGPIEAVNLCGEQPLLPYEACNLGSINLVKFIEIEPLRSAAALKVIDWNHLAEVVEIAVRFLDDVISVGRYPLSKVDRMVKGNRKIGLGVMGWADTLVKLGIPYDSDEALNLAERVMKQLGQTAHLVSQNLGREKGSFPNFAGSRWQKKVKWIRNATCTTIAPTGSISMVAGVSSGIEPLFALSFYKEVFGGARLPEVNSDLLNQLDKLGQLDKKDEILKTGSIAHVKEIPERIRRVFVTSHEIPFSCHVKMQAAFQKYTDNAVSKTINLPNSATVEDVEEAFMLAWKCGCKGITIYRDHSRKEQVLHAGS
ncbi:adenosylcobalamin-dependent ribonucleoside-diphosphate reductase, partial [Candidatus Gottesmanbacteria bacterium]|nr:adenosylcobalamin-dependent ribonucleoside-diphosphate reductase [Candidatus Gottesmanbacteria bacterium]